MTDRALVRSVVDRSLFPDEGRPSSDPTPRRAEADRLVGRWERLLGEDPLTGAPLFDRRLASLGITREQAPERLMPRELPPEAPLPSWAELLEQVLLRHGATPSPPRALEPSDEERATWGFDVAPVPLFPEMLGAFVSVAASRVGRGGARSVREPDALAPCWRYLLVRLSRIAVRTVAHEVKRRAGAWQLAGETSEARYQYFMRDVLGSQQGLADLLTAYPVLARLLATCADDFADATVEVCRRATRDARVLARVFGRGRALGPVTRLVPGLSDPHDGGRTVCRATFASGLTLIYKPRGMAADSAYADFIALAAGRSRIKTPKLLDRGTYGWSERILERECSSKADVSRYFRRQGIHLAAVYLLRGQDFHAENFVAHGSQPVAVDPEGIAAPGPDDFGAGGPPRFRPLFTSSAATGMLPQWAAGDQGRLLSVTSALTGPAGRPFPSRVPAWKDTGTDNLRLEYAYLDRPPAASLPLLNGRRVGVERHVDDVRAGFARGYRAIARRKRTISGGRIGRWLARAKTRRLIRDTREYADLMFWSWAPDQLTSGAAYDVALELAWRGLSAVDPIAAALFDDEKASIRRGDIPAFRAAAGSRRVLGWKGRATGATFETPALTQVRRRLADACEEDLAWQQEVIRASIAMTLDKRATLSRLRLGYGGRAAARRKRPGGDPLSAAAAIGDALAQLAMRDDLGVRWIDLARLPFSHRTIVPHVSDPWLHAGTAGTALFLAHLARRTGSARYAGLARDALTYSWNAWRLFASESPVESTLLGGYSGPASLAYAFAECGGLLNETVWTDRAVTVAQSLDAGTLRAMANPDLLAGAAGVVLAILRAHRAQAQPTLLDLARAGAQAILAARLPDADGGGWRPPFAHRALTGAAHGASGIAYALAALDRAAPDDALRAAAGHGLEFESARYSHEQGDWPNLQSRGAMPHVMTGWCSGAAGVGLVRLGLTDLGFSTGDGALDVDLDRAIAATRRHLGTEPHHLCCGEAGRLIFLASVGTRSAVDRSIEDAARALVQGYADSGWVLHAFRERLITPSLFSGAGGLGLALLAASGAEETSRVLLLA